MVIKKRFSRILLLSTWFAFVTSCTPNKEQPQSKQEDEYQAHLHDVLESEVKNIFSYDTLAMLNKNNPIKKQIRGRWELDSTLFQGKDLNTKLILNGIEIEGLDFESNFHLKSSSKSRKGVYMFSQLGVYFIDNNTLFIKKVDGTLIDSFQIEKFSEKSLILSEKFRDGIKKYCFSLDLEKDKSNRAIYGPNYK